MAISGISFFHLRQLPIYILIGISMPSCQLKHQLGWLEGIWEIRRDDNRSRLEIWIEDRPGHYSGKGVKVVGTDTTLLESLRLYPAGDKLIYEPTVPDQNAGKAIQFSHVVIEPHKIIFENADHDFPQRIVYEYKPMTGNSTQSMPGDSLYVRVEALNGDGFDLTFVKK